MLWVFSEASGVQFCTDTLHKSGPSNTGTVVLYKATHAPPPLQHMPRPSHAWALQCSPSGEKV